MFLVSLIEKLKYYKMARNSILFPKRLKADNFCKKKMIINIKNIYK